jgi:hypothetical protein
MASDQAEVLIQSKVLTFHFREKFVQAPADHPDYYGRGYRQPAAPQQSRSPQSRAEATEPRANAVCDSAAMDRMATADCSSSDGSADSCESSKSLLQGQEADIDKENADMARPLLPPPRMALDPVKVSSSPCARVTA